MHPVSIFKSSIAGVRRRAQIVFFKRRLHRTHGTDNQLSESDRPPAKGMVTRKCRKWESMFASSKFLIHRLA